MPTMNVSNCYLKSPEICRKIRTTIRNSYEFSILGASFLPYFVAKALLFGNLT